MPRRRRPTPCRRLRSRQAKREGCWRTPPHLTANVRLVSRTCASCHVRDGVVTFLPRDGGRTYMTRHVVSQRTPPRGGCTTEPSSCDTTYLDQVSPVPKWICEESPSNYAADESCRSFILLPFSQFSKNLSFLGATFNEPPLTLGAFSPPIVARRVPCARRVLEVRVRAQGERAQGGLKGRGASALRARRAPCAKRRRRPSLSRFGFAAFSGFDKSQDIDSILHVIDASPSIAVVFPIEAERVPKSREYFSRATVRARRCM